MKTLEPAMKNLLIETLGASLVADQVEALGQMLLPDLNIHDLSGKRRNFTLSPRMATQCLVEHLTDKRLLSDFVKLLVEMDEETVLGKPIHIEGMEYFLLKLNETGIVYDAKKRKMVPVKEDLSERTDWGALKQGRTYDVTVASMDIVGSSELVKSQGRKVMENFYSFFWTCLKERLATYDGRIWSWAGDGGILAFAFRKHRIKATQFALEMQRVMPLINAHPRNPLKEDVCVRIGMHAGKVAFMADTGKIISDVINLAAHLEKRGTDPGGVSLTESIHKELPKKMAAIFDPADPFEDHTVFSTTGRIDQMQ